MTKDVTASLLHFEFWVDFEFVQALSLQLRIHGDFKEPLDHLSIKTPLVILWLQKITVQNMRTKYALRLRASQKLALAIGMR